MLEPPREFDAVTSAVIWAALEAHRILGPGFPERVLPIHQAQVLSYPKATGCRLGLLINFHERLLRDGIKRVVLTAPA